MAPLRAPAWTQGPERPRPARGALDVWRADLGEVRDGITASLDAAERRRAAGGLRPAHARLWARSRGVLRSLLGLYLSCPPSSLEIATDERGKPYLASARERPAGASAADVPEAVSFSLSHSGALALYAFGFAGPVGVDAETGIGRERLDTLAIAARTFGAAQAARLRSLEPTARTGEFLSLWVRHEARLKCLGVGLTGAPGPGAVRDPWIAELALEGCARGAVAASTAPQELRCWTWPPAPPAVGRGGA